MVKDIGYWLETKQGIKFEKNNFSPREVEEICPQVEEAISTSREKGKYQHVLVQAGGRKFYILINSAGSIEIPRGHDSIILRTPYSSNIRGFRTKEHWARDNY